MTRPIIHHPDPCGPHCVAQPSEDKSQIGFEHDDCLDIEAEIFDERHGLLDHGDRA